MEEVPLSSEPPHWRVGLTYNLKKAVASELPDNEAEYDEYSTILAIKTALEEGGFRVELMEADETLPQKLAARTVDIVFNIAEGTKGRGREAQVPALLNFYQIPFTGSDETTLCIALDKALTKRILASYRIRTPKYTVIGRDGHAGSAVPFPSIVKPNAEGSSKGINNFSIIQNRKELNQLLKRNLGLYRQEMLVEEYIQGREFTVGVLGNGPDARVFPAMEIVYKNKKNPFNIYSFEVKKDYPTYVQYECPAHISPELQSEIENTSRRIYEILGCRDFARMDYRLSPEGLLYFIEINPLPGLAPGYSDYPMLAAFNGMEYNALVRNVLAAALKRYGLQFHL
jgi:D-alanine-D-alanine ligase